MTRLRARPPLILTALLLTACGGSSSPFANPFQQQISVTLTPGTVTLLKGASTTVALTGQANGSAVTGLTVTPRDVPAGLTLTPGTGSLTVAASADAAVGTYNVPLTVTAPGGQGEAQVAVIVSAADYVVTFASNPLTVTQGTDYRVALTATQGGANDPAVKVQNVTGGLKATLDGDPLGFKIQVRADQTIGTYVLQVTTSDGVNSRVDNLTVNVQAPATSTTASLKGTQ